MIYYVNLEDSSIHWSIVVDSSAHWFVTALPLQPLICRSQMAQEENLLSPEGKKIPTRGRGAARLKQEEAPSSD